MKEKIIIPLDFDSHDDAQNMVNLLEQAVFFKVGLQAFLKYGEKIISHLKSRGKKLFLDLKFKDIPNTVAGAIDSSLKYSPSFLTIHLTGGAEMVKRAVEAAQPDPELTILGVTILTSLSNEDLVQVGSNLTTEEAVLRLCDLGLKNGIKLKYYKKIRSRNF